MGRCQFRYNLNTHNSLGNINNNSNTMKSSGCLWVPQDRAKWVAHRWIVSDRLDTSSSTRGRSMKLVLNNQVYRRASTLLYIYIYRRSMCEENLNYYRSICLAKKIQLSEAHWNVYFIHDNFKLSKFMCR